MICISTANLIKLMTTNSSIVNDIQAFTYSLDKMLHTEKAMNLMRTYVSLQTNNSGATDYREVLNIFSMNSTSDLKSLLKAEIIACLDLVK
jgi:hypothetical protein